jgi:metal-responsive CopG/Arc/MetJ family transcriptional regulator
MNTNDEKTTMTADDGAESAYVPTSVYFQRDVLEMVDAVAREDERSRSWIINRILRDAIERRRMARAAA